MIRFSYNVIQFLIKVRYGLHFSKPLYPLRILRNFILGKVFAYLRIKKFVLRGIGIQITYSCNFNCNYCLCKKLIEEEREKMTVEDYKRVCKQAMKLGCTTFGIEGGEPFMRKDWEDIIRAFHPRYNHIIITTNSSFLTEELVKKLRRMGVDTLNLSLDSGLASEHDEFTGCRGNFDKVMKALEWCKKYGIKPIFNTVLWKGNLYSEGFKRLLEISEANKVMINTMFVKATGNFRNSRSFMLDSADIEYYYNLRKKHLFILRHLDYNFGRWGCPGAKEMLNITPYGDVFICANCHISGGNLKQEDLNTIRNRMLKNDYLNKYEKCLLAQNPEFMNIFYPLMEDRLNSLRLEEFERAVEVSRKKAETTEE